MSAWRRRLLRGLLALVALALLGPAAIVVQGLVEDRDLAAAWRAWRAPGPEPVERSQPLPAAPFDAPRLVGSLRDPELVEISGLAASRRGQDVLFAANDGGNPPRVYALSREGALRRAFDVAVGEDAAVDWEDLASFRNDGKAYLLIADVGDNRSWRKQVTLLVLEEPDLAAGPEALRPAFQISLRYSDGPRDCEAVAVDEERMEVLLISKRTAPPVVYHAPLAAALRGETEAVVAEPLVALATLPPPSTEPAEAFAPAMLHMPTALDITPDGSAALVLSYVAAWLFPRRPGQSWAEAFAATPASIALPPLPLAEALAWVGPSFYVTSEMDPLALVRWRAPLVRFDPREAGDDAPSRSNAMRWPSRAER